MSFLVGEYKVRLDDKGRVKLPVEVKRKLFAMGLVNPDQFVVKDGFDGCLDLFPQATWEKAAQRVQERFDMFNPEHRVFLRSFLDQPRELSLDAADRLLLPSNLLSSAGIGQELIILGQMDRFELWEEEQLLKIRQIKKDEQAFNALASKVMGSPGAS